MNRCVVPLSRSTLTPEIHRRSGVTVHPQENRQWNTPTLREPTTVEQSGTESGTGEKSGIHPPSLEGGLSLAIHLPRTKAAVALGLDDPNPIPLAHASARDRGSVPLSNPFSLTSAQPQEERELPGSHAVRGPAGLSGRLTSWRGRPHGEGREIAESGGWQPSSKPLAASKNVQVRGQFFNRKGSVVPCSHEVRRAICHSDIH